MRTTLSPLLFLSIIAGPASSPLKAAERDAALKPVTAWNLDATASGCALRRGFGDAKKPLILEMRRFEPGNSFQLRINGDEIRGVTSAMTLKVTYGNLPTQSGQAFQIGTTERPDSKPSTTIYLNSSLVPIGEHAAALSAAEAGVKTVTLNGAGRRLALATGSLGKPFEALRACTDELVRSWGLDPAIQKSLRQRPVPIGLRSWSAAFNRIWPTSQASKGGQGRVNFRMLVDATGNPTACTVLQSYNDPAFDRASCAGLMRAARFKPALDQEGTPIASYYVDTIVWTLD